MSLAEFLKYVGIIITGLSGIAAILGQPRRNGKLTRVGKILVMLILFGVAVVVLADRASINQLKKTEKIEREWSLVLDTRLLGLLIGFFIPAEASLDEINKLIKSIDLSLTLPQEMRGASNNVSLKMFFKLYPRSINTGVAHNATKLIVNKPDSIEIFTTRANLFKIELSNSQLIATSLFDEEVNDSLKIYCGFSGFLPWDSLGIKSNFRIRDIVGINFTFNLAKVELRNLRSYKKKIGLIGHITFLNSLYPFRLDLGRFRYSTIINQSDSLEQRRKSTWIQGSELLSIFHSQFLTHGGLEKDDTSTPDTLYSFENLPIKEIRQVFSFGNI